MAVTGTAPVKKTWNWLGSQQAVRVISILMVVYLLMLGWLTYRQAEIVECQASYADASARSTQARVDIAAQDRRLTLADQTADEANEVALDRLLGAMAVQERTGQGPVRVAFAELLKTRTASAQVRATSKAERARLEEERRKNPPPDSPTETCG